MATTTLPQRQGIRRGRWLGIGIAVIVVVIIAALAINGVQRRAAPIAVATVPVARGNIVAAVAGSGTVAAEQSLDLPFKTNGTVTKVLVKEGDLVTAGQVLAQLDDR